MTATLQKFTWNDRKATAALRLAEDEMRDEDIATEAGITRQALAKWKTHPDFQARIKEHVADLEASVMKFAVAKRRYRMSVHDDTERRLAQVISERAADPSMQDVPGGSSGLVVRQVKVIGTGRDAQTVEEYAVDTGLVRQRNQNLQQAAQDAGQGATVGIGGVHGGSRISFTISFDRISGDDNDDQL